MDRIKVPSGSIQKLETIFDNLQNSVQTNLNKRVNFFVGNYGILNSLVNNIQNQGFSGLKLSITDFNTQTMTIQPGNALLKNGEMIILKSAYTFNLQDVYDGNITANTYYQIHLKYEQVGTNPVVAQNAFFFDRAGLTPYSERYTKWFDNFVVVAYVRYPNVDIDVPDDEIPIAIIKTASIPSKLLDGTFTYQNIGGPLSAYDSVIDIRHLYTSRFNHNLLDDNILLFKDRNSVGTNKVNALVEFNGIYTKDIIISGIGTFEILNVNNVLNINNQNTSIINIKSGNEYNAGIVYSDTLGQRGYTIFDYNDNFIVGFNSSFNSYGEGLLPNTPPAASFVISKNGFFGNHLIPTTEIDIKNTSTNASKTSLKISHIPVNTSQSTIFNFGTEFINNTDPAYGRGFIKPETYNRPFEFLDINNNYVLKIDNANRKVYVYSIEIPTTAQINNLYSTISTISQGNISNLTAGNATINNLVLSGLSVDYNCERIMLPGTASPTFRVGVGSLDYPEGREVLLADPKVNTPANFRIYDVSPTHDRRESMSYVHLKWNWDGLNGIKQGNNQIVLNAITTTGETLNLTHGAAVIRQFYFSSSGNIYNISSYNESTRTITLTTNFKTEDIISDVFPAKIIDPNVKYYNIRCIEQDIDEGLLTKYSIISNLDYDNIALNPEHIIKLELNKKWSISIRAGNNNNTSPYVTMLPGSYDPDHVPGGQTSYSYSSPFFNKLPFIDNAEGLSTPSLTLTSTAYGFKLDIEGWEGNTRDISPHEFEIAYTTLSGITWENSSFSTTKKSGATFIRTVNRTLQISTNQSAVWTVGVRPIQNNQPVGVPIMGTVQSGGGGIVPQDTIVVGPFNFNIMVASGIFIHSGVYTDEYLISGFNNELWGENSLAGTVLSTNSTETVILSNSLRF